MAFLKRRFGKKKIKRKSTKKCFGLVLPIDTGWLMGDPSYYISFLMKLFVS